ncbi:SDR family oxidoreductase [Yokenella regensburgei]|uniref:SDR family oxidoreductase n=1 Tax=Yokenella regensburgei TaxID=158877 RepID=UPI003ED94AAA
MKILVAGATGSIGLHVVNIAIEMGHQPIALVRNKHKVKWLPRGADVFYGDVAMPETLTHLPKDIDAIIFTLGSDGQGRIGARAIDYGGVRNILRIFKDTPVRIALMTTIGVTERLGSWNQRTEVHDWKRRAERLLRASGHSYTIVRPGWFDYNNEDEHRIVMLQGDRRHTGTPEDGAISREQIARVLVSALTNDKAKNKTFELVAIRGEAQQDLTPLFADLQSDDPQKNDGVLDTDNMPLSEEPECIINELDPNSALTTETVQRPLY